MKGQGAVKNVFNRFEKNSVASFWEEEWEHSNEVTKANYSKIYPKTIVNAIKSIDLPFEQSLNPYQGCEHGCSYCYARPTHEYWSLNAGVDFERKILFKANAAELFEKHISKKTYKVKSLSLSGNTDCYQPAERKLKITRRILEICLKYKHPVGIITKNSLILRDLDILIELQKLNLISVAISITTLDDKLRQKLEPRTSSVANKLRTIETLSQNNIPVMTMMAPIIPSLNNHEILPLAEATSKLGATDFSFTVIRLNDIVEPIFIDWLNEFYPDRSQKIINQIRELHSGNLGSKTPKERMKGSGVMADTIRKTVQLAKDKYFRNKIRAPLDFSHFEILKDPQLNIFE